MILTNCAACAAPLAHDAPRSCLRCCFRCSTRYCSDKCQIDHWRRGHEQICEEISRRGGPEQIHADRKYKKAVAVAVEACAADTKGQKCYICLEAVHSRTGEGLVRGCACGDRDGVSSPELGVAHVSCLARQAKELVAEAEENNLVGEAYDARWARWSTCGLCGNDYHSVVACALGWACWKTYLGRPEADMARILAMSVLGNGLSDAKHHKDALSVREAELAMKRRLGASEESILCVQTNLANSYRALGRLEQALQLERDVYHGSLRLLGEEHRDTLLSANNYASSLHCLRRYGKAKSLLRRTIPVARRVLGEGYDLTLRMRRHYAMALCQDDRATLADLREAVTTLEDTARIARRVLGGAHPGTTAIEDSLRNTRAALRARETPPPSSPPSENV